jgi:hypothetical protein
MTDENKLINILLDNAPRFVNKFIKNQDKFIFFRHIQQDLDKYNKTSDKYTKKYHKLEQTHQDTFHRHIYQETLVNALE